MPRDLRILNQGEWFLQEEKRDGGNPGYPIYYRYAIAYSIANTILNGKTKDWVAKEIEQLITSIKEKKPFVSKDFVEVYPLVEDKGYVLVDQTNSYYPLIFYSLFPERNGKRRDTPLMHSLQDIKNGLDQIYEKLSELRTIDDWTPEFQQELFELFPVNQSSLIGTK